MLPLRHAFKTRLRPSSSLGRHVYIHGRRPGLRCLHESASAQPWEFQFYTQLLDGNVQHLQSGIEALHTTYHLPWYAALPLTAFIVRLILLPIITIPSRRAEQRYNAIAPIIQAHAEAVRKNVPRASANISPAHIARQVKATIAKDRSAIRKRWGAGPSRTFWLPVSQLPFFLAVQEAIRRITGTSSSLLGLAIQGVSAKQAEAIDGLEAMARWTQVAKDWMADGMKDGGCLWFTDLTVADPTGSLSIATGAVMFLHLWLNLRRRSSAQERRMKGLSRGTRFGIVLTAVIMLVTLNMPSGIVLYWFSSSMCTLLSGLLLDIFMPLKRWPISLVVRRRLAARMAAMKRRMAVNR